jgi:hypothetical protein
MRGRRASVKRIGNAHGRMLTGPAMGSPNGFEVPSTMHPAVFSTRRENGKLGFYLPPCALAVGSPH